MINVIPKRKSPISFGILPKGDFFVFKKDKTGKAFYKKLNDDRRSNSIQISTNDNGEGFDVIISGVFGNTKVCPISLENFHIDVKIM